jgi:Holliday junction resolvase
MASNFQNKLIRQLKNDGWLVVKTIRLGENGFPDLFCFRNGVAMFIESKEANDTLKPLQQHRIDQLIKQGFDAKCLHETKGQIYPPI